jgi:hypothetical protein
MAILRDELLLLGAARLVGVLEGDFPAPGPAFGGRVVAERLCLAMNDSLSSAGTDQSRLGDRHRNIGIAVGINGASYAVSSHSSRTTLDRGACLVLKIGTADFVACCNKYQIML